MEIAREIDGDEYSETEESSQDEILDETEDAEHDNEEDRGKRKRRRSRSAWNVYLGSRLRAMRRRADEGGEIMTFGESSASCSQNWKLLTVEDKAEYRRRSKESNSGDSAVQCPMCSKTYKRLADLNKHAKECGKRFNCDYEDCNKNYSSAKALLLHVKTKHNGEPSVKRVSKCPECGALFRGTSNAKRHLRNVHCME